MADFIPPRVPLKQVQNVPPDNRAFRLGLLSLGLVVVIGLVYLAWFFLRPAPLPPRENLSADEQHRATKNAFASTSPTASDEESRSLSAALDRFNAVLQEKNSASLPQAFDFERLCDEIDRMGGFHSVPANQIADVRKGLITGMSHGFEQQFVAMEWSEHRMKKAALSDDRREATVYDLEIHGTGAKQYSTKVRWWMRKHGNEWKVWDFEELEGGLRLSTITTSAIATIQGNGTSPLVAAVPQLQALNASMRKHDWPAAEAAIKVLDGMTLTPDIDAIRDYCHAAIDIGEFKYEKALKDCDATEATGQDIPIIHQFRAVAYNHLGQYEKSLESAKKWEETLGGDREVYYQMGVALAGLHRSDEAAVAFGRSLDEDPDSAGSLAHLSAVLPEEKKSELARRFAMCKSPAFIFVNTVPVLQRQRDLKGMETLIAAYRNRTESADDPWLVYYDGELKVIRKQYKEAETELQPLLPLSVNKEQAMFAREYFYAARLAGDSLQAYATAPDPQLAFSLLASRLLIEKDNTMLTKLVAADLKRVPNDAWGFYYQAKLHQAAGEYDAADASYATAMKLADVKSIDRIRSARVDARFKNGLGLSAYHDIAPADKVFLQLAGLFYYQKQGENLAKLVEARRADAPDDPALPMWDGSAKFLAGEYAAVLEVLSANRATLQKDKLNHYKWNDLFIRSLVRLKQFDAARQEAKPAAAEQPDWWHIAIVECAAGNANEGTRALDTLLQQDDENSISDFYADPDIGPALATPAFAEWREKHPGPATQATTMPTGLGN